MQDGAAHQVDEFGEDIFALMFGGVDHGGQRCIGARTPFRAETAHDFAMNHRWSQGAFASIIIGCDILTMQKDE